MSRAQLAAESGVEPDHVARLVEAGALRPDEDGLHAPQDVLQIRLIEALAEGGVGLDDVSWAVRERGLPLDRVAELWTVEEPTGRTFAEFCASLGARAELLPAVYAAFGLALPAPETTMRRDEETALTGFLEVWGLVEDRPDVYTRAARILGEGVRRIDTATADLFGELGGPPPARLAKGLSPEEAQQPSRLLLGPVMEQALVWLHRRHTEHEIFERIVTAVEQTVARAGRKEEQPVEPPAIAFVDLAGYTKLAETAGDEQAAHAATLLHALALDAARAHGGRVVKLLGDGVMLRYGATGPAVASVAALMAASADSGLPRAHAGIATGPIVSRDGDVYGHTVNLAARIAGQAAAGELLLLAEYAGAAADAGFACEEIGPVSLKGVAGPIPLARVLLRAGPA